MLSLVFILVSMIFPYFLSLCSCLLLSPYLTSFLIFISLFPSILPGSIFRCYYSFNSSHFCLFYCCYYIFISYVVSFFQYVFFIHHEYFLSPCYSLIPCIVSSIFPINLSLSVSVNMLCYVIHCFYPIEYFSILSIVLFLVSFDHLLFILSLCTLYIFFNRVVISFLILKSNQCII